MKRPIPIITGILVIMVTNRLTPWISSINIWCYLGIVIMAFGGYIVLLILLKHFFYYYEYKVKPDWFPIISIGPDDKNYNPKQEDDAAKFNYEVMYLIESAYNHANKIQTQDELLLKASLLNNLFCIKNALRKMNESLLGCSGRIDRELVSDSMITVALELVIATINILQSYNSDITCMYQDEIDFVRGLYDDTKKQIKLEYGI